MTPEDEEYYAEIGHEEALAEIDRALREEGFTSPPA